MTPQQVNQVQTSFTKIVPIADKAAALFYGRLFEMAPETQALFCGDMNRQGWKLMSALATVVKGLRDFEAIVPIVRDLARRHVAYGVQPEHYALVGSALLWTLEQGLGDEFTPALRAAWAAAYCALSEVMIASAYPGVTASLLTEPIMTQVQSGNGNQASKPFRRQSEPPGFADSNCPRVCKERDEHTI
jgi:nitric oxide dioxygenase